MSVTKWILIKPYGRTGNNIIEYMLALYLKSRVPDLKIYCNTPTFLSPFKIKWESEPSELKCNHLLVIDNGNVNLNDIIQQIITAKSIRIIVSYCLFTPYYYNHIIDSFKSIFCNRYEIEGYGEEYLVINIRLGDILNSKVVHPNYPVVPFSFYSYLLRKTGLKPVFLGEIGNDCISLNLRTAFPQAIIIPSRGIIEDFECLRRSRNLSIAVSTFSFLAGYLSDSTTTVHVPLYGGYNPVDRPDSHFVIKHPKYHYYFFPSIKWTASQSQINQIISNVKIDYVELCK